MTERVPWAAQPGPQKWLVTCPVFEVLFGGARGGGKTDGMLGDWLSHSDLYGENAIGLMVRRRRTELVETVERARQIFVPLGATLVDNVLRMPDAGLGSARLRFAYLERDADADNYQGHSYTRVYVEEIGNFPSERPVRKLLATLRSGHGVPVGFRATANPGGPGHLWVKRRYIDPAPAGMTILTDPTTQLDRVYIPSRLEHNRYLGEQYVNQLKGLGSPTLVRAWLEGDWSAVEGAFFPEWSTDRHVLRPFALPATWPRFRSVDWGSAKPFSVGWWAIVQDDTPVGPRADQVPAPRFGSDGHIPRGLGEPVRLLPRGALVRYREWYGSTGEPNTGLKLTATEVAKRIISKSGEETFLYTALDPSMFAQNGGPSLAEMMLSAGLTGLRRADNTRIGANGAMGGWDQMRGRLKGQVSPDGRTDGHPMLFVFETCADFIRTVPVLQHDLDHPEDLDTEAEDHAGDECRYACMSRPWVPALAKPEAVRKDVHILEALPGGLMKSNLNLRELIELKQKLRNR